MALLPIIYAPDPRLKIKCRPVEIVDQSVRDLMRDMLETMYAAPGIGLSAPQVGDDRRIIVCDVAREDEEPQPVQLINPEIVWASEEIKLAEEGCLSLPSLYGQVRRPKKVHVEAYSLDGDTFDKEITGLFARVVQHETDQLDGV